MSWRIYCVTNSVKISKAVAKKLCKLGAAREFEWDGPDDIVHEEHLIFNSEHMEHMDFLDRIEVQDVLKAAKVKGDITFFSEDGAAWGYRFDGKGGMVHLDGELVFTPAKRPS